MAENKEIKVCVSGYFTVLHKGHVQMFEAAKELGDKLVVIVNNRDQQLRKKGKIIMEPEDIKYIIEHLNIVDEVVISIDKDSTQNETLCMIKPDIFANGGDRTSENVPEDYACEKCNIKMVFGVGGDKVDSSSRLIKEAGL